MQGSPYEGVLNSYRQLASAGAPLANSAALTDVSAAPQLTLPADFIQLPGQMIKSVAFGVLSTTGTPTILVGLYWGGVAGVALGASAAIATGSAVVNVPWRLELSSIFRTVGATGTVMSQGFFMLGTSVSAIATTPVPATALATVTADTTTAKALTVGAQWGTANAANTLTCHGYVAELRN